MAPNGLGLLCALTPPGQTQPPPRKYLLLFSKKKFVLAFCVRVWPGFAFQCVFASIKGAYHLSGQSVAEVSCWVLGIAEQAAQRNRERSSFLHLFEQPWPALHVTVGCAPLLGRGPSFFPELPLPAILLLHLHSNSLSHPLPCYWPLRLARIKRTRCFYPFRRNNN